MYNKYFESHQFKNNDLQANSISTVAKAISNDFYFTYANLSLNTHSVAMATVIFTAKLLNLPMPFIDSTL